MTRGRSADLEDGTSAALDFASVRGGSYLAMRSRVRPTARGKAGVFAAGALGGAVLFLTAVASAPARNSNSCGPCPLVATIEDGAGTMLLQATATSRPPARSQMSPFQARDRLTWRLTFHDLDARVSRATIRLGKPTGPARYLFTLCGPCVSGAHGEMPLGNGLAQALSAGVTCRRDCPPAAAWPVGASLHVLLADEAGTRVAGQLRYCLPNQYLHRNSCAPPGY
jgi:hypothetical protein